MTGDISKMRAAPAFDRRRLAQGKVQRVHMAALAVDHAADIAVRGDMIAHLIGAQHLLTVDAIAAPERPAGLKLAQMRVGQRGKDIAGLEVALNAIGRDPFADDVAALGHQPGDEIRRVLAIAAGDGLQAGIQPVHHLPAIAPRGAPADARPLDHGDLVPRSARCSAVESPE
jgi:hypothetical protein